MSGKHQRTWQQYHVGHLLITVQLDSAATGHKLERHQDLAGVTRRLISLADSERLPVTWAVSDPAHSAATSLILQSPIEHEMAILGDATWVGATAPSTTRASAQVPSAFKVTLTAQPTTAMSISVRHAPLVPACSV